MNILDNSKQMLGEPRREPAIDRAKWIVNYWRNNTFINCWNMSDHESNALWQIYCKSTDGVVLQTSYEKLNLIKGQHSLHQVTYPTPGKVLGMIHDTVADGKEHMPVLTIGYLSDMIIITATKPVLPVQKIIEKLQKEIPQANVDGGGHEMAGTIKFVPAQLDIIIEKIKEELKKIQFDRE